MSADGGDGAKIIDNVIIIGIDSGYGNVSPANAKQEAEKVDKSENHIPTFFLFAKNEADQGKIKDTVTAIFDKVGERCIVVDFSSLPFTDALFSKFIESKAKEKYFSTIPNQKS